MESNEGSVSQASFIPITAPSVIEDTPVLHLTATTSGVIPGHQGQEIDENAYMTEEFLDGVKGARYTQYGQFISGYSDTFEELVAVLDKHTQVTGCKFHMDKVQTIKLTDQERISFINKFNTSSMKPRLFWMANKGEPSIPYDAVPFATASLLELRCSLGTTSKKRRLEDLSAYYCDAKIFIRGIWRFPLAVFRTAGGKISLIRKAKQVHMERLSTEISAGVVIPVERYYFSLPTGRAHTSHDVPHFPKPGRHFSPLHHSIVENIFNILKTGNTYIDDITQLTTEFTQQNLLTELTINSGDESLIVTREKVNGHIYHGFIDRQVVLPEPASILSEESIRAVQQKIQETSGIVLSPQVLQPVFRIVESSGELASTQDTITAETSGSNVEIYAEEEVNTMPSPTKVNFITKPSSEAIRTPTSGAQQVDEKLLQAGNEVRSLLRILDNQTYACRSMEALQTLRRTLTDLCSEFSNSLYNTPTTLSSVGKKRSAIVSGKSPPNGVPAKRK